MGSVKRHARFLYASPLSPLSRDVTHVRNSPRLPPFPSRSRKKSGSLGTRLAPRVLCAQADSLPLLYCCSNASDVKQYPKVCLSPQRRSFGSGCSWKETPSGNAPSATPPSSNPSDFLSGERDDLFFEMEGSHPPPAPGMLRLTTQGCI